MVRLGRGKRTTSADNEASKKTRVVKVDKKKGVKMGKTVSADAQCVSTLDAIDQEALNEIITECVRSRTK